MNDDAKKRVFGWLDQYKIPLAVGLFVGIFIKVMLLIAAVGAVVYLLFKYRNKGENK